MLQTNNLKRIRDEKELNQDTTKMKIANKQKSNIFDFQCSAFLTGKIFDFQLSQVFNKNSNSSFNYVALFFCSYNFSPQSKKDLYHIEDNSAHLIQYGALPIVITQDGIQLHSVYATPGKSAGSLTFQPSFILASDSTDRLIARAYKSIDSKTHDIQRTIIILDHNLHVLFYHKVPHQKFFPMKMILNCFEQSCKRNY
ncbi:uncharacterized protein BX663DRAFT_553218 [Cokeromyces recurvatus]|uniref:uncharacterized protein n=1 Tax=Cokeromyces recurvatus TaxID=90255 RepID=UPI002220AA44|nr:uncharacterized protein BX663DRAFT_553218 [Cokeromyces recurvatus]KAI7901417.1 hypothetical protein BX663DRAFT_553218 [Cokeromyces recurvatus]